MSPYLNNLWIPDILVGVLSLGAIIAGVIVVIFATGLWKALGALLSVLGVAGMSWLIYAANQPWTFREPPLEVTMVEQQGQQILLVPHGYIGDANLDVVNLNVVFARSFPKDAVFTVRYLDFKAIYYGIRFTANGQRCPYVIEPPNKPEKG